MNDLKKEAAERYKRIIGSKKNLPFEIINYNEKVCLTISDSQSILKLYSEEEMKDYMLLVSAVTAGLINVDFDLLTLRKATVQKKVNEVAEV